MRARPWQPGTLRCRPRGPAQELADQGKDSHRLDDARADDLPMQSFSFLEVKHPKHIEDASVQPYFHDRTSVHSTTKQISLSRVSLYIGDAGRFTRKPRLRSAGEQVFADVGAHREAGDRLLQDELERLHRRRRGCARTLSTQHTRVLHPVMLEACNSSVASPP